MDVVAVYNSKGGVGKSTTTVNLAAALAESGTRVLVLDLDTHASASLALGVSDDGRALADALTTLDALPMRETRTPGVLLAPGGAALADAERVFATELDVDDLLRDKLAGAHSVDVVLIDAAPGGGRLAHLALLASTAVVVPVTPTPLTLAGLTDVTALLQSVREGRNPGLALPALLLSMVSRRPGVTTALREELRRRPGVRLLECEIHRSSKLEQAAGAGRPITGFAPTSHAAAEFRRLAAEFATLRGWAPAGVR